MTWQESLRQLDARLANGEIGAADYRRTRDEILAEASSGNQANGQESGKDGLWTATNPSAQPDTADEKTTDIAPGETTVVVRQDELEDERTQVVKADAMVPAPGNAPPPPPPWPVAMNNTRSAPIQGQEVFAGAGKASKGRWLRWFAPLVILALVAGGIWWFVVREDAPPESRNEQSPTITTTEQAAPAIDDVAADFPELPGQPAAGGDGTATTGEAQELQLLSPGYATLLEDNGASELVHRRSQQQGVAYQLMAAPVESDNGASELAGLTTGHLEQAGFTAVEPAEEGPTILTRTDQIFQTYVTTYASGDIWVQLNASGKPNADAAALLTEFRTVLQSVTARFPAG